MVSGFSVHAGVGIRAAARKGLECLLSYAARPPVTFISQTQTKDSLSDQIFYRMFNPLLLPVVGKTTGESLQNSQPGFHFSQQQSAGLGTDIAAIKVRFNFPVIQCVKFQSFPFTLCHQKGRLRFDVSDSSQSLNATRGGLFRSLFLFLSAFHAIGCEKLRIRENGTKWPLPLEEYVPNECVVVGIRLSCD
jgi:hypothetical protein